MRPLLLQQALTLGTPSFVCLEGRPEELLAANRVTINVAAPNFVIVGAILVNGLDCLDGATIDAWVCHETTPMTMDNLPTMRPKSGRVKMIGWYTGLVPETYQAGDRFDLRAALWRNG